MKEDEINYPKIIFLVGMSGAGKSTYATKYINDNPDTIRVNRDDLRKTFVGTLENYYSKDIRKIEKLVTSVQHEIIAQCLYFEDFNVIIDNTNLKIKYISDILEDFDEIEYEFVIFDTDMITCKDRVYKRDNVDVSYITKQAEDFNKIVEYIVNNYEPEQIKMIHHGATKIS